MLFSEKIKDAKEAMRSGHFDINNAVQRVLLTEELDWERVHAAEESYPSFRTTGPFADMLEQRLEQVPSLKEWKKVYPVETRLKVLEVLNSQHLKGIQAEMRRSQLSSKISLVDKALSALTKDPRAKAAIGVVDQLYSVATALDQEFSKGLVITQDLLEKSFSSEEIAKYNTNLNRLHITQEARFHILGQVNGQMSRLMSETRHKVDSIEKNQARQGFTINSNDDKFTVDMITLKDRVEILETQLKAGEELKQKLAQLEKSYLVEKNKRPKKNKHYARDMARLYKKQKELEKSLNTLKYSQRALRAMATRIVRNEQSASKTDVFDLKNVMNNVKAVSELGSEFSRLLMATGSRSRGVQTLYQVSGNVPALVKGVEKMTESVAAIQAAISIGASIGTAVVAGALTGGLMAVTSLISIVNAFSHDDDERMDVLREELNALRQELAETRRVVLVAIGNFAMVAFYKLDQLDRNDDHLTEKVDGSFKELHSTPLKTILYNIGQCLSGEWECTLEEHRKLIRQLAPWLEEHSSSSIQTSAKYNGNDLSKLVAVLSDPKFDRRAMLGFLAQLLNEMVPNALPKSLKIDQLPNLSMFMEISEVYASTILAYQLRAETLKDNYVPSLKRAMNTLRQTQKIIAHIDQNADVWETLFLQYDTLRERVGLALGPSLQEVSGASGCSSLGEVLPQSPNSIRLFEALAAMEWVRLMLDHWCHLTGNERERRQRIERIESRSMLLTYPLDFYRKENAGLIESAKQGDLVAFKKQMLYGAYVNAWSAVPGPSWAIAAGLKWGQPLHWISIATRPFAVNMLHTLFKAGSDLQISNGSGYPWPETWGENIPPVKMMLNNCFFQLAFLWLANGHYIGQSPSYFYNAYWWANNDVWHAIVQKYLVKHFAEIQPALEVAMKAYNKIQSGLPVHASDLVKIDHDLLLWVASVLGMGRIERVFASLGLVFKPNVNSEIPLAKWTPLMMAAHCGRSDTAYYLLQNGADDKAQFETVDPKPYTNGDERRTHDQRLREVPDVRYIAELNKAKEIQDMLEIYKNKADWKRYVRLTRAEKAIKELSDMKSKIDYALQHSDFFRATNNTLQQLEFSVTALEVQKNSVVIEPVVPLDKEYDWNSERKVEEFEEAMFSKEEQEILNTIPKNQKPPVARSAEPATTASATLLSWVTPIANLGSYVGSGIASAISSGCDRIWQALKIPGAEAQPTLRSPVMDSVSKFPVLAALQLTSILAMKWGKERDERHNKSRPLTEAESLELAILEVKLSRSAAKLAPLKHALLTCKPNERPDIEDFCKNTDYLIRSNISAIEAALQTGTIGDLTLRKIGYREELLEKRMNWAPSAYPEIYSAFLPDNAPQIEQKDLGHQKTAGKYLKTQKGAEGAEPRAKIKSSKPTLLTQFTAKKQGFICEQEPWVVVQPQQPWLGEQTPLNGTVLRENVSRLKH